MKTLLAFDSKNRKAAGVEPASHRRLACDIDETERPAWLKRAGEAFRNDDGTAISRMIRGME